MEGRSGVGRPRSGGWRRRDGGRRGGGRGGVFDQSRRLRRGFLAPDADFGNFASPRAGTLSEIERLRGGWSVWRQRMVNRPIAVATSEIVIPAKAWIQKMLESHWIPPARE